MACGAELRVSAKFCPSCGAPVEAAAVNAREWNPRAYTPKHLADKILQSKSALEGERKQVTVLFADVKGSMELAEQFDAEEWHRILDRFFQILTEGVHRFEGTVNQYTGDGIMALFGAPIAHEDHARRACWAGLHLLEAVSLYSTELKRRHGFGLSMRLGLNSGEVVVGKIGDDLRMDYTAQGHVVGMAQRMEALASPDTCYLTDATASLVAGFFELQDLGEFPVRGSRRTARVHRLIGAGSARTHFDLAKARGLSRFVGREADMAALDTALDQARDGNGQVVGVVAEAGAGKSRLCFEFAKRCRSRGIRVVEGRAVAHGRNIPNLPVLQVFRAYYGISEHDDDRVAREKIAGRMLLIDEAFRDELPILFEFFGVLDPEQPVPRMDPQAKQERLFSVLRRVVRATDAAAGGGNTVAIVEDLHWLDAGSEALIAQWVDAIAGTRSLLVVNFRPEFRAAWTNKSYYRQLPLVLLDAHAVRELLEDLLGRDESTEGLAEAIHSRTRGNPFFTEEVVHALIESGHLEGSRGRYRLVKPLGEGDVPASVQAVLAARIDRLPEREKRTLQTAAVIGKEFAEPILRAVLEIPEREVPGVLAALEAGEFLYEQALFPVAEYAFKHPLTQEVALGSVLLEHRRRLHASVARAIESAAADRLDERAALIAHHLEEAGEPLRAAGWSLRASEWVGQTNPSEGVAHLKRVLALTDSLEAAQTRQRLRLQACEHLLLRGGWRTGLSLQDVERYFTEGRDLARRAGSDQAINVHVGYAHVVGFAGDVRRYHEVAKEALALVDQSTSPGPEALGLVAMAYSSFCLGRLRDAFEFSERIGTLVGSDSSIGLDNVGFSARAWGLLTRAEYGAFLGGLEEAWRFLQEAIRLSRALEPSEVLPWSLGMWSDLADLTGVAPGGPLATEARSKAVEALGIAMAIGSHFSLAHAYRYVAVSHLLASEWKAARDSAREVLADVRTAGNGLEREAHLLAVLSRAHLGAGEVAEARAAAEEAIARAQEQGARCFECLGHLALARALRVDLGPETDAVDHHLACAAELVEETGAQALAPQIAEERARLAGARGEAATEVRELEQAQRSYVEIGATGHAERVAKELQTASGISSTRGT